jgi:hypothetical protein
VAALIFLACHSRQLLSIGQGKECELHGKEGHLASCIAEAVNANQVDIAVQAAEEAAKKSTEARAARAEVQERSGGRFTEASGTTASLPLRSMEDRLRAENKFVRDKLASVIAEHNASRKNKESETERLLHQSQQKLKEQEGELQRLRQSLQAYKFRHGRAQAAATAEAKTPRLISGTSAPTLLKMAKELNDYLVTRFSSPETIQQALFQHYLRIGTYILSSSTLALLNLSSTRSALRTLTGAYQFKKH